MGLAKRCDIIKMQPSILGLNTTGLGCQTRRCQMADEFAALIL